MIEPFEENYPLGNAGFPDQPELWVLGRLFVYRFVREPAGRERYVLEHETSALGSWWQSWVPPERGPWGN